MSQLAMAFMPYSEDTEPDRTRRRKLERAVRAVCDGYEIRIDEHYTHELGFNDARRVVRLSPDVLSDVLGVARYMGHDKPLLRRLEAWERSRADAEEKRVRSKVGEVGEVDWRTTFSVPEDLYVG